MAHITDNDELLFRVGGVLHEARMRECWGKNRTPPHQRWPEDLRDFRRQRQLGQPHIDIAIAQIVALDKEGMLRHAR